MFLQRFVRHTLTYSVRATSDFGCLFLVFVLCCCLAALFFSRLAYLLSISLFFFIYYFLEFHKLQLIVFIWNCLPFFCKSFCFFSFFFFLADACLSSSFQYFKLIYRQFLFHSSFLVQSKCYTCFYGQDFYHNKIQCTKSVYLEMYIESGVDKYLLNGFILSFCSCASANYQHKT